MKTKSDRPGNGVVSSVIKNNVEQSAEKKETTGFQEHEFLGPRALTAFGQATWRCLRWHVETNEPKLKVRKITFSRRSQSQRALIATLGFSSTIGRPESSAHISGKHHIGLYSCDTCPNEFRWTYGVNVIGFAASSLGLLTICP